MAEQYNKANIQNTYFTILILDDCYKIHGEVYDELSGIHCPQTLEGCARKIREMQEHDKDFKDEPKWSYRIVKHEEDDDADWQTVYKVYKYRGKWKVKPDWDF